MQRNALVTCATCPFFFPEGEGSGTCRFNAPIIGVAGSIPFPIIAEDAVCGRHPDFFRDDSPVSAPVQYMGSKK